MKVLLGEDTNQFENALNVAEQRLEGLLIALDAYKALGIATVPTVAEMAELQDAPRAFLVRMMTNRQPISLPGGLTVSADKFYDMLEKPAGAEEFVATVTNLFDGQSSLHRRVNVADYELKNGRLQLKQSRKDELKEQSRFYATTDRQQFEYSQLKSISVAFNNLHQSGYFGESFSPLTYLARMLKRQGNIHKGAPAEIELQEILKPH